MTILPGKKQLFVTKWFFVYSVRCLTIRYTRNYFRISKSQSNHQSPSYVLKQNKFFRVQNTRKKLTGISNSHLPCSPLDTKQTPSSLVEDCCKRKWGGHTQSQRRGEREQCEKAKEGGCVPHTSTHMCKLKVKKNMQRGASLYRKKCHPICARKVS